MHPNRMWLFFLALPLAIVLLVGGLLAGGIYTIVFLPIAVIIAGGALLFTMWGRATTPEKIPTERARDEVQPLPHSMPGGAGGAPTSPEGLVDAQRQAQ